ncbi:Hydroxyisourate hydrolase [Aulographum hederae CBS 113979]|uniref:hydroxyisourate hydrolase n=1 Tax=Aulographum hederae CBS 113979 TaxID=1176131 RepID=A0A6G1GPE4_9PEZI|nr:Hydroxyisourate hydrolase [Aulographum hederae CBS 113979]
MSSHQTKERLSAITSHLEDPAPPPAQNLRNIKPPTPSPASKFTMAQEKPPITCHVLDTTTGLPATGVPCTLTVHISPVASGTSYTAVTNEDGRVAGWTSASSSSSSPSPSVNEVFKHTVEGGKQTWSIKFEMEEYYKRKGVECFFPEAELRFVTRGSDGKGHYHVPLLVGPFGYTTYRGS